MNKIVSFFTSSHVLVALGILLTGMNLPGLAVTRYVNLNNPTPASPYTNWATAATTIQDAVNISIAGDVVLVTNGVYATGGTVRPTYPTQTNRVMITNSITVASVNGPLVTSIVGQFDPNTGGAGSNAVRCVFISGGGRLYGFTLTNGAALTVPNDINTISGGGLFLSGGTASNLIIRNCRVSSGGGGGVVFHIGGGTLTHSVIHENRANSFGAGVFFNGGATLRNCLVTRNTQPGGSGGAGVYMGLSGAIEACTIAGNQADAGPGGLVISGGSFATVTNTIIYGNTGNSLNQYAAPSGSIFWSCTTPLPSGGVGNIDSDPRFLDAVSFRLHPLSPCVDAGTNQAWMASVGAVDLDGEPRLRNGRADIGADEAWQFQALTFAPAPGAVEITWDTAGAGTFAVQGSTNLPSHTWSDTGVIVTSVVAYVTTTVAHASIPYEAYRLRRTGP